MASPWMDRLNALAGGEAEEPEVERGPSRSPWMARLESLAPPQPMPEEREEDDDTLPSERLRSMRERFPEAPSGLRRPGEEREEAPGYLGAFGRTVGRTATAGATGMAELGARLTPAGIANPRLVEETFGRMAEPQRRKEAEAEQELAEASADMNPWAAGFGFWGAKALGMAADPVELLPGGMAAAGLRRGAQAARRGLRGARRAGQEVVEEAASQAPRAVPSHAGQAGESPEAIARVARGERYYRVTPSGETLPIPNTVDAVDMRVNPGEAKVRVTSQGTVEIEQGGRGGRAQAEAIQRLEEGVPEAPLARGADEAEPGVYELDAGEGLPSDDIPLREAMDDPLGDVLEDWIDRRTSQGVEGSLSGHGPMKRLSEEIRSGEAPEEVVDAAMRRLGNTLDRETGEVLGVGNPDWPRTGTLLDFLDDRQNLRIEASESLSRGSTPPPPRGPEDEVIESFDRKYFQRDEPRPSIPRRLQQMGQRIRDEMEDEYQPILRSVRESKDPQAVRETEELLQQVRAAPTRSEIPVLRHTSVYDEATGDEVVTGGSLLDVMKGHDEGVLLDAERYMAAQRNLELAERAQKGAGLKVSDESIQDAQGAIEALRSKYGQTDELDQIAEGYRDWAFRAQIDPLVRVGVYDAETARRITEENSMYAIFDRVDRDLRALGLDLGDEEKLLHPFQKKGAGGGGGPRAGSPAKRIHGGLQEEGKLQGIFESSALQAMRVKKFADRQAAKNMLGRLGDEVEEVPIQRVSPKTTPVARILDEGGEPQPIFRSQERGGQTFIRYEDGQRVEYAAPGDVIDALGRLTPRQASAVLAPARLATQMLRVGAVEIPSFAVFNVIRDMFLAPIFSRHGMLPVYDVARTAVTEAGRRVRGRGPSEAWSTAEEFGGFSTMMDVDRASMRRSQKEARRLVSTRGNVRRFLSEWKRNPLLPFHVVGASLERLNRATEASLALQGGRKMVPGTGIPIPGTLGTGGKKATKRSAGLDAAEITLNFMRGGSAGKVWNRYEAFSNAMLQDVSKFAREMKQRPFEITTKAMAFAGIPSAVNYAINRDDPDYQRLPEWEKALFYHPGKLENGWWVRVPRPLGVVSTVFGYGTHKAIEAMDEADPKAAKEFLDALVETTPAQFLAKPLNLMPNIAQPAVEASPQVNYSQFLERPIVPRGQEEWPAQEQYGPFTSQTMKDLGQVAGLSPRRAQYVFESHTGTLGRESLALLDRLRSSEDDETVQDPKDIPVVGRFLSRPAEGFSTDSAEEFFDLTEKAMGARSVVRSGQAKLQEYPEARLGLTASRFRRRVGDLSDRKSRVRGSKIPDSRKKEIMRRIDQQISGLVEDYIERHREIVQEER